jgi:hypothetical protein
MTKFLFAKVSPDVAGMLCQLSADRFFAVLFAHATGLQVRRRYMLR